MNAFTARKELGENGDQEDVPIADFKKSDDIHFSWGTGRKKFPADGKVIEGGKLRSMNPLLTGRIKTCTSTKDGPG